MRAEPWILVVALVAAGCVVVDERHDAYIFGELSTSEPVVVPLSAPAGLRAFDATNAENVSVHLAFKGFSSDAAPATVVVLIVEPDREPYVSSVLHVSGMPSQPARPELHGAGATVATSERRFTAGEHSGIDFYFTDATAARLVVAWSGIDPSSTLTMAWHVGTTVTPVAASNEGVGFSHDDMEGGTRVVVPNPVASGVGVVEGDAFTYVPPEGEMVLGSIEVPRTLHSATFEVVDEDGTRTFDSSAAESYRLHAVFAARGSTRIVVHEARDDPWILGMAVALPQDVLPASTWLLRSESN